MSEAQPTSERMTLFDPVRENLLRVQETLRRSSVVEQFPMLANMLDHILDFGGKHMRPGITLLCSKFAPCDAGPPVLMATAVELLHIATLVHDDTIDKANVRRGRPTVSTLWGKDVAVLLGDYVFAKSATYVCDTGDVRVIRRFAETIMALASGELQEYLSTFDASQTLEQYYRRIDDKTASLFTIASESGGMLAGLPEGPVDALRRYGHNLGMAYQVVDDLLDFEGDEEVVGKPVGSDLRQGVMTLPAILFRDRYTKDTSLAEAMAAKGEEAAVERAVTKIRQSRVLAEARRTAEGFAAKAQAALGEMPEGAPRRSLGALTEYVLARKR